MGDNSKNPMKINEILNKNKLEANHPQSPRFDSSRILDDTTRGGRPQTNNPNLQALQRINENLWERRNTPLNTHINPEGGPRKEKINETEELDIYNTLGPNTHQDLSENHFNNDNGFLDLGHYDTTTSQYYPDQSLPDSSNASLTTQLEQKPDTSTEYLEETIKTRKGAEKDTQEKLRRGHKDNFTDKTEKGIYLRLPGTDIMQFIPRIENPTTSSYTEQASKMMNGVSDIKVTPISIQTAMSEIYKNNANRKSIGPWKIETIVK